MNRYFSKPFHFCSFLSSWLQSIKLWQLYFDCIVQYLIQPCLQLESFTANKRTRILSRYKDLRVEASNDLKSMWFNLCKSNRSVSDRRIFFSPVEQHRLHFIPNLIDGIVRVSLIPVQDIRTAMIRVLCDMIYIVNKQHENLAIFENEFVMVMDKFANEPLMDKTYKEYLINA